MDMEKIGKFICKLRKEKMLTQEQLGELININGKSISKWETGINLPDISNLKLLSEIFDVSINELLTGQRNVSKENTDKNIMNVAKYYKGNAKHKIVVLLSVIILLFFVIMFLISNIYFFNNYGKHRIYNLVSNDEDYVLDGYLLLNPNENILIIENINYQGNTVGTNIEPKINKFKLSLQVNEDKYLSYSDDKVSKNETLSNVLDSLAFSIVEDNRTSSNIIKLDDDLDNISLIIEYYDENNKYNNIEVKINLSEIFTNNKIVY